MQERFDSLVVKRVKTLFNSFCCNVAKQVAQFSRPVYRTVRSPPFIGTCSALRLGAPLCVVYDIARVT